MDGDDKGKKSIAEWCTVSFYFSKKILNLLWSCTPISVNILEANCILSESII